MPRPKGIPNKRNNLPPVFAMTTQERIQLLANIIVDRIIADTTPRPTKGEGSGDV